MATFYINGYYTGDFVPLLTDVDTEHTMAKVAEEIAYHSQGRRLPYPPEGTVLEVFIDGEQIDPDVTLGSLGLEPMPYVTVRERRPES